MNCHQIAPSLSHLAVVVAAGALITAAAADQIREIHNASLTSYVPSSKSNIQDVRPGLDTRMEKADP